MTKRIHVLATSAALVASSLAAPLAAQTASFKTFGQGCSAQAVCESDNAGATSLDNIFFSQTSEVAIPVTASATQPVRGFEILTKALFGAVDVQAHVYLDTGGQPNTTPAISGTMRVDTATGWYRVTFARNLVVTKGQTFYLSWTDPRVPFSQVIHWPVPPSGTKTPVFNRTANSGAWRGPFTVHPWAWRVLCPAGREPVIGANGLPKLGTSFDITLATDKPNTAAIWITGVSNRTWSNLPLPLDLGGLGAPGCQLNVSFDVASGVATDATASLRLPISIPNSNSLLGVIVHQQFATVAPSSNALGLEFSSGATWVVGN